MKRFWTPSTPVRDDRCWLTPSALAPQASADAAAEQPAAASSGAAAVREEQAAAEAAAGISAAPDPAHQPLVTPVSQRHRPASQNAAIAAMPAPCVTPADSSQRAAQPTETPVPSRPPSQAERAQLQPLQTPRAAAEATTAAEQAVQTPRPSASAPPPQQVQPAALGISGVFSPGTPTGENFTAPKRRFMAGTDLQIC